MFTWFVTETPLRFLVDQIWRDEAFSYLLASRSIPEIITLTAQDFNPPLYYLVLHGWMNVFGSSEIALRSLSVLFAVAGFFAVYEFFTLVLRKSPVLSAALTSIVVLNPLLLFYAFEARMYSMLFCAAAFAHLWFFLKKPVPLTITLIIGLFTHYFMAFVILAQMISLLLTRADLRRYLPYLAAGAVFLPWAIFFLSQLQTGGGFWISSVKPEMVPQLFSYIYTGLVRDFWFPFNEAPMVHHSFIGLSVLIASVLTTAVLKTQSAKKDQSRQLIYWLLQAIVPVAVVLCADLFIPLFLPRYLISVSLAISMLVIVLAVQIRGAYACIVLGIFVLVSLTFQQVQLEHRSRGDINDMITRIETELDQNDLIYVTSELDFMPAQYYAGVDRVFIYNRPYDNIPQYVGKVLIPETAVTNELPVFPQKAAIIDKDSYRIDFRMYEPGTQDLSDQIE